jgi:hypothetical protein
MEDNRVIDHVLQATNQLRLTAEKTRELYSKLRNEREKATFSMMMRMNPEALMNIRKEFFLREDAVKVDEFIYIINKHLLKSANQKEMENNIADQREFGFHMYELFKEIDVNGDGDLEWLVSLLFMYEGIVLIFIVSRYVGIHLVHRGKSECFKQSTETCKFSTLL